MRKIFFLLIIILSSTLNLDVKAANVITNARLEGTAISASSANLFVNYDKYSSLPAFTPNFSNGLIEFGIDETKKIYHNQAFTSIVSFTYNAQYFNLVNTGIQTQTLIVDFAPGSTSFKGQAFFKIPNAVMINITKFDLKTYINYGQSGQTLVSNPLDLYIESSIDADETLFFNYLTSPFPIPSTAQISYNVITIASAARELQVYWDYLSGAEQYELEYIYVDDYDATGVYSTQKSSSTIDYDFLHDATRIVTTNQYYNIPLIYERGYLLFRVRGVGRSKINNNERLEGLWSNPGFESGVVSTFAANFATQVYYISTAHEADNINWSASRTFAENGKSGTGVSYEDGLMKNRQSVAKINTENKTIVQSSLYDWHGRPAISVLPSPNTESYITYKQNQNLAVGGLQFDKNVFDNSANFLSASTCLPSGLVMSSSLSNGAAKYYSSNNIDKEAQQALVPDAQGFPYVQVEYYPDQTGRIKRQTLPGNTHYLGSGKEVQSYYAQPSQQELCRLFGTEVGNYDEYEKNINIDPNGQISVSYHDDEGKVIATGLFGANPSNLLPIEGALDPASIISTTLANNVNDPINYVLELSNNFFGAQNEVHTLHYDVTVPVMTDGCAPTLCMDCIYELEISVKDQCGIEVDLDPVTAGVQSITKILGRYLPNSTPQFDASCPTNSSLLNFSMGTQATPISFTVPKAGTYHVNKKLKLSTAPLQYYAQQFIANNTCISTLSQFQQEALQNIDLSSCNNFDCASCSTSVVNAAATLNPPLSQAQINILIEKCELKCDMKDVCSSREKLMRMHFKPGGYFAKYNLAAPVPPATVPTYTTTNIYSIFNPANSLTSILNIQPPPSSGSFSFSAIPTTPGYGSYVINDPVTNLPVAPNALSIQNYIALHNSNFSDAWVKWHPEYCKLQFYCDGLISSITTYSNALFNANTYNEACQQGLLLPFSSASSLVSAPVITSNCPSGCTAGTAQYIPLVNFTGSSNFSTAQITAALTAFTNSFTSTTYNGPSSSATGNLFQFAVAASNSISISGSMPALGSANCDIDFQWNTYKMFYLNLVNNLIYSLRSTFVGSWSSANGGCLSTSQINALPNYVPVFEDPTMSSYPIIANLPSPSSNANNVIVANVTNSIQATCLSFCQSYVNNWINDLGPCSITQTQWTTMQNDLVNVCASGCDSQDPFGASTTTSGIAISIAPYTVVNSFQDVLNAYGYSSSPTCNAYLITFPKPKGYNLGGNASTPGGNMPVGTPTLDACSCDKILTTHNNYVSAVASTAINPCVISESAYFQTQLGITLPYLSSYTCICSQAYDSNTNTYNFNNVTSVPSANMTMFPVPPSLGCKNCKTCYDIANLTTDLVTAFGTSNTALINQTALENFLNSQYNSNNTLQEWLDFIQDCESNYIPPPPNSGLLGTYGCGNGVVSLTTPQTFAMGNMFNLLSSLGFLNLAPSTNPHVITQANASSFFNSSLYTLTNLPSANANVIVTNTLVSTELEIHIVETNYNCVFTIPIPSPLTATNFQSAQSLAFTALSGLPNNSFYLQITYYDTTTNTTISNTVIATNTCFSTLNSATSCEPKLCSNSLASLTPTNSCTSILINNALNQAQTNYNTYINGITTEFLNQYKNYCYSNVTEVFERGFLLNEYQYTLYYYDRNNNLVHTVPPASVTPLTGTPLTNAVNFVTNGTGSAVYPAHSLNQTTGINSYISHYKYSTFDAPLKQITPDGGETVYFYDHIGRLVASRNAQQAINNKYSYTLYDNIGRITEIGVLGNISTALTPAITLNPLLWQNYLVGLTKTEVTRSYYEVSLNAATNLFFPTGQKRLRNRVSANTYELVDDNNDNTYDQGTFYSYDDHGNVNYLVQEMTNGYRKTIEYEYDLISGNVNKVIYNRNKVDQLYHTYYYDTDNRLHDVYTSQNGLVYQKDAKYFYYQHGPMARTEIGEKQVQATDYAFTIQGWVKGVNSNILTSGTDMGKDGDLTNTFVSSQTGIHGTFAKDAAGYNLNYFNGDYNPIKTAAANFLADMTNLNPTSSAGFKLSADAPDLYNGNISSMVTSIYNITPTGKDNGLVKPQIAGFKYDQLHRIKQMKAYSSLCINASTGAEHQEAIDLVNNSWNTPTGSNYVGTYEMKFDYDKLGNIKTLERQGDATFNGTVWNTKKMDKLTYNYQSAANIVTSVGTIQKNSQLKHIDEDPTFSAANYPNDIEDQLPGNYTYNGLGSLTSDVSEEIQTINWTAAHKVLSVIRSGGSVKPDVYYGYDAFGRRIYKRIATKTGDGEVDPNYNKETFYVLDVDGNVMAINEKITTISGGPTIFIYNQTHLCKQQFIYGASRLGAINADINILTTNPYTTPLVTGNLFDVVYGKKDYELTNHLGNIITTISDRKKAIDGTYTYVGYGNGNYTFDGTLYASVAAGAGYYNQATAPNGTVDFYVADIRTVTDYYAFGQAMPGRTYASGGTKYRYAMNGQEQEDEVFEGASSAEYWMYDSRTGRRFENDPLVYEWQSPY
ncbi:MAG: hypothetical protein Q7W45_10835, partial [Bacteroidota bacterium]|nr:hypothetical protein [Bacteroidota bacterium]